MSFKDFNEDGSKKRKNKEDHRIKKKMSFDKKTTIFWIGPDIDLDFDVSPSQRNLECQRRVRIRRT